MKTTKKKELDDILWGNIQYVREIEDIRNVMVYYDGYVIQGQNEKLYSIWPIIFVCENNETFKLLD